MPKACRWAWAGQAWRAVVRSMGADGQGGAGAAAVQGAAGGGFEDRVEAGVGGALGAGSATVLTVWAAVRPVRAASLAFTTGGLGSGSRPVGPLGAVMPGLCSPPRGHGRGRVVPYEA